MDGQNYLAAMQDYGLKPIENRMSVIKSFSDLVDVTNRKYLYLSMQELINKSWVPENVVQLSKMLLSNPGDNTLRIIIADALQEATEEIRYFDIQPIKLSEGADISSEFIKDSVIEYCKLYSMFIKVQMNIYDLEQQLTHPDNRIIRGKLVQLQHLITEKEMKINNIKLSIAKAKLQQKSLMDKLGIQRTPAITRNMNRAYERIYGRTIEIPEHDIRWSIGSNNDSSIQIPVILERYERGFISWIQCTTQWMINNLHKEIQNQPITDVVISDSYQHFEMVMASGTPPSPLITVGSEIPQQLGLFRLQSPQLSGIGGTGLNDTRDQMIIEQLRKTYPTVVNWTLK